MRTILFSAATLAMMGCGALTAAEPAQAPKVEVQVAPQGTRVEVQKDQVDRRIVSKPVVSETMGPALRGSNLIGMEVRSPDGKQLGSVNDLVLDTTHGRIRYAALSFGGFLGVGDKLFAVPWHSFQLQHDRDADAYYLTLDVTAEQLEKAPGFEADKWPDFADTKFTDRLDAHYGARRGTN